MKAAISSSRQHLELSMYADGQELKEYVLPGANMDQNILECFVAVKEGQQLKLKGKFEGPCLQASFDLVVDGSFVETKRLEDKGIGMRRRDLDFERAYDCPAEKDGWTSKTEPPIDVYEGRLYVEEIGDMVNLSDMENVDEYSQRPGVGSIQVVANVQDVEGEDRFDPEWDIHGSGWLRRHGNTVRPSGIKPDYAVEVRHISDEKVRQKRSRIHRSHGLVDRRYGFTPWARFVFYYRDQESIEAAGCRPRAEVLRELRRHSRGKATSDPLETEEVNEDDRLQSAEPDVGPQRTIDNSWESHIPFSTTELPKLSKLGGDFRSQLRPQSQSLQQATKRQARGAPTEGGGLRGGGTGATSDSGSQSLFVSENTPPYEETVYDTMSEEPELEAPHQNYLLDNLHIPSLQVSLERGSTKKGPTLSAAFTTSDSHSATNKVEPRTTTTTTPDPNDMTKLDQYLPDLPSLDQLAEFIGANGSDSLNCSKYFNKIAKENGFPANGTVRNKLRVQYNLLIRDVAHVDATADRVTLKQKYMPQVIKQENDEEEDTIEAMPKQQQQHNKPPPAPMVAPSIEKSRSTMQSPADSDRTNVLKRAASKSSTPDASAKKAKLVVENTAEVEAARARIKENQRVTEQLLKQIEAKNAKKAARQAKKAAEKQKEAEERKKQEQLEANAKALELAQEEERTQQAQIEALKALAGDDDDEDDDEDNDSAYEEAVGDFESYIPTIPTEEPEGAEGSPEAEKAEAETEKAEAEAESEED